MATYKSDTDLCAASGHLAFEMSQCNYTIRRLATKDYGEDVFLHNTLLTSFTIHARNLEDFLFGKQKYSDDMIASHYFDNPSIWRTVCPKPSKTLDIATQKVNKLTAHLTYTRETNKGFYWLWVDIHKDLYEIIGKFVDNVPQNRIDRYIAEFRNDWGWSAQLPHSNQFQL
ncbi:MAG: hypothetical protein H0X30_24525 [Anaerolineae bacterium]|nr:hypothetical protein [Anaerolineae bacterium]